MKILNNLGTALYNVVFGDSIQHTEFGQTASFGAAEWSRVGITTDSIDLPQALLSLLDKPCPFWQSKTIGETHQLCFIPKGVSLKSFWLKVTPGELRPAIKEVNKNPPYWILITKAILPGSRDVNCPLVTQSSEQGYDRPTALEASVAVYALRVMENREIYASHGTRCLEKYLEYPVNIMSSNYGIIDMSLQDWAGRHGEARVLRFYSESL